MKLELKCEYDIGILPAIVAFVRGSAEAAGATKEELPNFELAAEEISAHIIDSYLEQFDSEFFTISCQSKENGLEFSFEDKGLPIDPGKALSYDASSPDGRLSGLRFHLVRSVCDKFELKNLGKNGWMISFFKAIKAYRAKTASPHVEIAAAALADGAAPEPAKIHEKLELCQGAQADIPSIIELTYYAFRYTHEPEYYTTEGLAAMLEDPYHVFNLVKTESGKVVASQEYYVNVKKTADISFYGTIMTHPDYRDGGAILKLFKKLKASVEKPPHPDVKLWVQSLVTSHIGSQRFADILGASTCALDLSRDRVMDFSGDIKSAGQRESFLTSWRWLLAFQNNFAVKIHCLPEHDAIVKKIFSWQRILLETDVSPAPALPPSGQPWNPELELFEFDKFAALHASELPGSREEFSLQLRRRKDEAFGKGAQTAVLFVPTKRQLPAYLSGSLREHGFFFSGIVPSTATECKLQFTCLGAQSFDFGKLQLFAESTLELAEYVKGEYAKV